MTTPVLIGIIISVPIVWWVVRGFHRAMTEDVGIEKSFDKADIEWDFLPRANKDIYRGSYIRIVECEEYGLLTGIEAINKENNPWYIWLRKWVDRGARIEYLLVLPSRTTKRRMEESSENIQFSSLLKRIDCRVLLETQNLDPDIRKIARSLRTFHFVLIEPPEEKSEMGSKIWIERNHPVNETFAYGCEYADVRKAGYLTQYDQMSDIFDDLFEKAWNKTRYLDEIRKLEIE